MMQGMYDIKMVNAQLAKIVSVKTHLYKEWTHESYGSASLAYWFPVSETLQNTWSGSPVLGHKCYRMSARGRESISTSSSVSCSVLMCYRLFYWCSSHWFTFGQTYPAEAKQQNTSSTQNITRRFVISSTWESNVGNTHLTVILCNVETMEGIPFIFTEAVHHTVNYSTHNRERY